MRILLRCVAVAACSLGPLLGAAVPALAAPPPGKGTCDYTEYCMYEHANGKGGIVAVPGNIADYDPWIFVYQPGGGPTSVRLNDNVSSDRNHGEPVGATVVHVYRHSFQREEMWTAPIGGLHNIPAFGNDQASSFNWQRS